MKHTWNRDQWMHTLNEERRKKGEEHKYAPGPWEAQYEGVSNRWAIGNWKTSNPHAFVPTLLRVSRPEMDVDEANARLIAASPRLAEKGSLLLRTVWDALRHGLTDGQREALEEAGQEFAAVLRESRGAARPPR